MAPVTSVRSTRDRSSMSEEPVGIVIADGGPRVASTRFSAYVWGPVPDDLEPAAATASAGVGAEPFVTA